MFKFIDHQHVLIRKLKLHNNKCRTDGAPIRSIMKITSEAVLFLDWLFDSVNGSRGGFAPGKLRGPVKEVEGVLRTTSYYSSKKRFISIWSALKLMGVGLFYARNLNQDPLELRNQIGTFSIIFD
ncbi:hypothetical protein ABMA27_008970 [Loxostege sticticalis]|uniref:Uncharacterized protein n=1 Tax=Loxostege sticticalis TaxID=481309 RepID=A0ABR3H9F0_LOXSC